MVWDIGCRRLRRDRLWRGRGQGKGQGEIQLTVGDRTFLRLSRHVTGPSRKSPRRAVCPQYSGTVPVGARKAREWGVEKWGDLVLWTITIIPTSSLVVLVTPLRFQCRLRVLAPTSLNRTTTSRNSEAVSQFSTTWYIYQRLKYWFQSLD